jgi:hypothetical protein
MKKSKLFLQNLNLLKKVKLKKLMLKKEHQLQLLQSKKRNLRKKLHQLLLHLQILRKMTISKKRRKN